MISSATISKQQKKEGAEGNQHLSRLHAAPRAFLVYPKLKWICNALGVEHPSRLVREEFGDMLDSSYRLGSALVTQGSKALSSAGGKTRKSTDAFEQNIKRKAVSISSIHLLERFKDGLCVPLVQVDRSSLR